MTRPARPLLLLLAFTFAVFAQGIVMAAGDTPHGGRVGWARLITPNTNWGIHSDQDPKLANFIRSQTSLNIDPTWYTVGPGVVGELCRYPFIYVKDLSPISAEGDVRNLREYLQRGGFLCVDPCVSGYTPGRRDAFVERHKAWFARVIPGSVVRELPDRHEIYRCYFNVGIDDVFSPDMVRAGAPRPNHLDLLGVYQGDRMIALISLCGLECGWPQTPGRAPGCMEMIVNTYVYAMTRSDQPAPAR